MISVHELKPELRNRTPCNRARLAQHRLRLGLNHGSFHACPLTELCACTRMKHGSSPGAASSQIASARWCAMAGVSQELQSQQDGRWVSRRARQRRRRGQSMPGGRAATAAAAAAGSLWHAIPACCCCRSCCCLPSGDCGRSRAQLERSQARTWSPQRTGDAAKQWSTSAGPRKH